MDEKENRKTQDQESPSKEKRPLFHQEPKCRRMRVTKPMIH